jgi:protein involved in polysaccharide export with SLBB domain
MMDTVKKRKTVMDDLFKRCCVFAFAFLAVTLGASSLPVGQELRLEAGDKLQLTVPQRQELGRELLINARGEVYIPIIGSIVIESMTVEEAESTILRELQALYPSVQRIILTLIGEESRRLIYVHGQVLNPGKYEFEENPNVWEAIREAGGTTGEASLETIRLIRAEGEARRTSIVNLQVALDSGVFTGLPELRPGDTVIVPQRSLRYEGSGAVRVLGTVVTPAPYMLTGDKTLVDAVLAAGGPAEGANLGKVRIIRPLAEGGTKTLQVDFKEYINGGNAIHNPALLPGDTVYVPAQSNYFRVVLTDPRFLLGMITAAATITAIMLRD